jgi:hypothetical protein
MNIPTEPQQETQILTFFHTFSNGATGRMTITVTRDWSADTKMSYNGTVPRDEDDGWKLECGQQLANATGRRWSYPIGGFTIWIKPDGRQKRRAG